MGDKIGSPVDLFDWLNNMGKEISTANFDHVYHGSEILIAKLLIDDITKDHTLKDYFQFSPNLLSFCQRIIHFCKSQGINTPEINLDEVNVSEDVFGEIIQHNLKKSDRKTLASNYTEDIDELIQHLGPGIQHIRSICDHFVGSGNLIIGYLNFCRSISIEPPKYIRINDMMPIPVLVTYWRIKKLGVKSEIYATIGDGFAVRGDFDLVLINPPYTRSARISKEIRKNLDYFNEKINGKGLGHAGLHFWALIMLKELLTEDGQAFCILPRATINAQYSSSLKSFLLEQFGDIEFYQSSDKKAFSNGSELRELLLVVRKNGEQPNIKFYTLNNTNTASLQYNLHERMAGEEWNWGKYFLPNSAINLANSIKEEFSTKTAISINLSIKRGIEMYGPEFYFFPNKRFDLNLNNEEISIHEINSGLRWRFRSNCFEPVLRKPNLYYKNITPEVIQRVLVIDLPEDEEIDYFDYIKSDAGMAIRNFGDKWKSHPLDQIISKNLSGRIFIIDKLDIGRTPTLAYFCDEEILCTKNFYQVKHKNKIFEEIIAAWLNSTWYLLLYLTHRREIGGTYGRLQIVDYDKHDLFIPWHSNWKLEAIDHVINAFKDLRLQKIGYLPTQLFQKEKLSLDTALADLFGVELDINQVHETCASLLEFLKI